MSGPLFLTNRYIKHTQVYKSILTSVCVALH